MPPKRVTAKARPAATPGAESVAGFLSALKSPLKPVLQRVRREILAASPKVAEGIKWNCPSFFLGPTGEYFATLNVHARGRDPAVVLLILHQGAKVRASRTTGIPIEDPAGLLDWLAPDRAAVRFRDLKDVSAGAAALKRILRQWIARM